MNLQMDPLYNPLRTHPIQTGREMSMDPYPNRQFGFIDNPDRQSGSSLVPTRTRTRSDNPDPLLTLAATPECLFTIGDRQSEKKRRNGNQRAICDATRGLDAGRGVVRHRGFSDGSDGARPLTEPFHPD